MNALLSRHNLTLALGMAIPALVLRSLSLVLHFSPDYVRIPGLVLIVRGLCSDLFFSWLVGTFFGWFLSNRRRVYFMWTLAWSLIFAGNVEHIGYNDSNFNVLLAGYAVTSEFFTGNILVGTLFLYCLVASTVSVIALWWIQKRDLRPARRRVFFTALGIPILVLCVPTSLLYDDWLQESLLETNAKHLLVRGRQQVALASSDARRGTLDTGLKEAYLSQDLRGDRRFEPRVEKPNVLLVLIESLGIRYVNERTMPFLDRFGREHLRFSDFVAHQHLTIKGLYCVLSGDYPNLKCVDCKSDIVGMFGTEQPLLPGMLSREGFATVFLQGAPLGFMRKDLFADKAGFERVYGAADFESAHQKGAWGVDDRTLFERALEEAHNLEQPWFMTLLTSGSHPPYNIPPGFLGKRDEYTLDDAFRYTDTYLEALVEGLRKMGALENTLILITSDEVKGDLPDGIEGALEHFRSPLVVYTPERYQETVEERFGHLDLTLSVLDYLGQTSVPPAIKGRSIFRKYDSPRNLLLGRFTDVVLLKGDKVHFVSNRFHEISSYQDSESGYRAIAPSSALVDEVKQVVEYSDLAFSEVRSEFVFRERKRFLTGFVPIVAQLSISVRRGENLTWEVKLNTKDIKEGTVGVRIQAGIPDDQSNYRFFFSDAFDVDPGSEISFSRSFEMPVDLDRLDSFIFVQTPPGKRAFLEHAHIKRVRR